MGICYLDNTITGFRRKIKREQFLRLSFQFRLPLCACVNLCEIIIFLYNTCDFYVFIKILFQWTISLILINRQQLKFNPEKYENLTPEREKTCQPPARTWLFLRVTISYNLRYMSRILSVIYCWIVLCMPHFEFSLIFTHFTGVFQWNSLKTEPVCRSKFQMWIFIRDFLSAQSFFLSF